MIARRSSVKTTIHLKFGWMVVFILIARASCQTSAPKDVPTSDGVTIKPNIAASIPLGANGKPLTFDIVSFRRAKTWGSSRVDIPDQGDSIGYRGQPLARILYFAYFNLGQKIEGAPEWVNIDLYDFQAKVAAEDVPVWQKMSLQSRRLMVRKVLEDSAKLQIHAIDKPEPIYELVVANGGLKLKEHVDGESKTFPDGQVVTGTDTHWISPVEAYFQANTMSNLAASLSAHHTVDRDVVDKTGLTAKYDFTLPVPYSAMPPEMLEQFNAASIFSEVQKLGLKLIPGKAVFAGVVIDHIERPEE